MRQKATLLALPLCLLACRLTMAAGEPAITNVAEAGIDYKIQGEYRGSVETEDGDQTFGAQVIALGDSEFRLIGYKGGLPGAGWDRSEKNVATGKLDGDKVVFEVDVALVTAQGGKLIITVDGNEHGTMSKVTRQSKTLGKKPPKGATVLFDGSTADRFENGKLVEKKLLGATGCSSIEKFGDHHLHLEFRTPFMAKSRGQRRGNSGVYVQSRYEVQVLDSFGLEGEDNECGGIYKVSRPLVNMCFPPLTWQSYDIDFTAAKYKEGQKVENARITVRHNGVVIHDNIELPTHTPGRSVEADEAAALFLQDHGDPVVFRNIWVLKK